MWGDRDMIKITFELGSDIFKRMHADGIKPSATLCDGMYTVTTHQAVLYSYFKNTNIYNPAESIVVFRNKLNNSATNSCTNCSEYVYISCVICNDQHDRFEDIITNHISPITMAYVSESRRILVYNKGTLKHGKIVHSLLKSCCTMRTINKKDARIIQLLIRYATDVDRSTLMAIASQHRLTPNHTNSPIYESRILIPAYMLNQFLTQCEQAKTSRTFNITSIRAIAQRTL